MGEGGVGVVAEGGGEDGEGVALGVGGEAGAHEVEYHLGDGDHGEHCEEPHQRPQHLQIHIDAHTVLLKRPIILHNLKPLILNCPILPSNLPTIRILIEEFQSFIVFR